MLKKLEFANATKRNLNVNPLLLCFFGRTWQFSGRILSLNLLLISASSAPWLYNYYLPPPLPNHHNCSIHFFPNWEQQLLYYQFLSDCLYQSVDKLHDRYNKLYVNPRLLDYSTSHCILMHKGILQMYAKLYSFVIILTEI